MIKNIAHKYFNRVDKSKKGLIQERCFSIAIKSNWDLVIRVLITSSRASLTQSIVGNMLKVDSRPIRCVAWELIFV